MQSNLEIKIRGGMVPGQDALNTWSNTVSALEASAEGLGLMTLLGDFGCDVKVEVRDEATKR